jgi:hypothetical protein
LLRSNAEARAEAKAAIEKVYGRRDLYPMVWIVQVLGAPGRFIEPVDLARSDGKWL